MADRFHVARACLVGLLLLAGGCTAPTGGPSADDNLTIMAIQGDARRSPLAGRAVTATGVVTLLSADGRDFWMQDPDGDGDAHTSDGVLVAGGGFPPEGERPAVGDLVRVTATVDELQFGAALPLTRLSRVARVEVLSEGHPLPAPVELTDLPDEAIPEGIAFWEPLEGMRVRVSEGHVVSASSRFGEFALLSSADARSGSGFASERSVLRLRPLGEGGVDYNPERILVDDASLRAPLRVRPGDRVTELVGVVDYSFGNYKLQPERFELVPHELPAPPVSAREGPAGELAVTTFNLGNLFDAVDTPGHDDLDSTPTFAELETKLAKLTLALVDELNLPAILLVQEVETTEVLQALGERVDARAGTDYRALTYPASDGRGITLGFLWDAARVELLEAYQLAGPEVERAFGRLSPSPGREPLVGAFDLGGQRLVVINNHFKSKSGDAPLFGVKWPPERVTEAQRKAQARAVRAHVNSILAQNPDAWLLAGGDLNDFSFGEPGEGADHPLAILAGDEAEAPLTNLLARETEAERYTFVFDGNAQALDHLLASPALLDAIVGVDVLHFNADFPASLSDDPTTPLRASDHDPVEVRLRLTP